MIKYLYRTDQLSIWINKLLNTSNCGAILSLPESGVTRSIIQVFENNKEDDKLAILDLNVFPKNKDEFYENVQKKINQLVLSGIKTILVGNCKISKKSNIKKIKILLAIRRELKKKIIYIFHINEDTDGTNSKFSNTFLNQIFENSYYFSYANKSELKSLINQNEERFGIIITQTETDNIFELSGGIPYLVKIIFEKYNAETNQGLDKYLEAGKYVLSWFSNHQICQLINFLNKSTSNVDYFEKIGLIREGKISSKIIEYALRNIGFINKLKSKKDRIYVNQDNVTKEFGSYEKEILEVLINDKKLSKEKAGEICYGKNGSYTNTALDQIISRLRKKLVFLGVDPKVIKTEKGWGYVFTQEDD